MISAERCQSQLKNETAVIVNESAIMLYNMLFFNLKLIDNRLPLNTETILYYFRGLPYLWNKTGATVAISFSEQKKAPWLMLPAQKWTSEVLRCPNWSIRFHHFNYNHHNCYFRNPIFFCWYLCSLKLYCTQNICRDHSFQEKQAQNLCKSCVS